MKCETMEDLQTYEQLASNATGVSYYDSELLVARNVDANVLNKGDKLRMKGLFVILCTNGNLTIELNNEKICLNKNDLFFCHSMQVVANIVCSDDFRCDVLAFTIVRFSGMLNHVDGKIIQNIIFMKENPVMELSEGSVDVFESYLELFEKKHKVLGNRMYEKSTSNHLVIAMLLDLINMVDLERIRTKSSHGWDVHDEILHRFFVLLASDNIKHRTVKYYADQLCITPKSLSVKCSKSTGKTPSQWMRDVLVEKIRYMLLCTNCPIKEIANTLEFPNVSFFGRYVKEHLGCSPAEFRRTNK